MKQHTSTTSNTEIEHKKWYLKHYGLQEKSNATLYKEGYYEMMKKYSRFVTTAATLTFKTSDWIEPNKSKNKRNIEFSSKESMKNIDLPQIRFQAFLNEEIINSSLRYFTTKMNRYCFGRIRNYAKRNDDNKLLILFFVEGDGIRKHKHVHLAMGNIPDQHLMNIRCLIRKAWSECDLSNYEMDVRPTYNTQGWLNYEVKEVEYGNTDVFNVVQSCIPRFIQDSV